MSVCTAGLTLSPSQKHHIGTDCLSFWTVLARNTDGTQPVGRMHPHEA